MRLNSEKLRVLMFRQGRTQTDLAGKTSVSRNTISSICNGKSCRKGTAEAIAAALGVTLEEIKE